MTATTTRKNHVHDVRHSEFHNIRSHFIYASRKILIAMTFDVAWSEAMSHRKIVFKFLCNQKQILPQKRMIWSKAIVIFAYVFKVMFGVAKFTALCNQNSCWLSHISPIKLSKMKLSIISSARWLIRESKHFAHGNGLCHAEEKKGKHIVKLHKNSPSANWWWACWTSSSTHFLFFLEIYLRFSSAGEIKWQEFYISYAWVVYVSILRLHWNCESIFFYLIN